MASVQPRAIQKAMIDLEDPWVTGNMMKLFQAGPVIGPTTVLTDLTEATFTGYTPYIFANASQDGLDPLGNGILKYLGMAQYTATTITATEVEGGWFVVDKSGTILIAAANFDNPISFAVEGDTLLLTPYLFALFQADVDSEFISGG